MAPVAWGTNPNVSPNRALDTWLMLKPPAIAKFFLTLALTPAAFLSIPATAQVSPKSQPLKAEQVMGMKVENSDGQELGTVRNLVLDTRTGQLKFAVLASGGFFGVKAKQKL